MRYLRHTLLCIDVQHALWHLIYKINITPDTKVSYNAPHVGDV